MRQMNEAFDFHKHIVNKDIDSRIKKSRDDTLKIIQADIKVLDPKVDKLDESVRADIKVLDSKVDNKFEVLDSRIDKLDAKVGKNFEVLDSKIGRLDDKIDNVVSMKKWVVGMFVTILLAVAALVAHGMYSFVG